MAVRPRMRAYPWRRRACRGPGPGHVRGGGEAEKGRADEVAGPHDGLGDRRRTGRGGGHRARSPAYRAGQADRGAGAVLPVRPGHRERSHVMTADASARQDREELFVADFYPQFGEYPAEQRASGYDAEAGRARFLAWLREHADDGGEDEEIFVFGGDDDDLPA